jgi:predicted nuclease of predicted toxin-antitoxin system
VEGGATLGLNMKFKIDENLPIEMADLLRRAGHDALTVSDELLGGSADTEVISICRSEGRALVTLDTDFANIRIYPPEDSYGLIVLRLKRQDKAYVLEIFSRLIPILSTEPVSGELWIVEEKRIRIRP